MSYLRMSKKIKNGDTFIYPGVEDVSPVDAQQVKGVL